MNESIQGQIFQEWLGRYRALLFKVIKAYAFNTEDQNDLFQDTCLQIYRSIPNFKAESSVSTWLYRISLNTAIKWSTQERRHVDGRQGIEMMPNLLEKSDEPQNERMNWLYSEIKKLNEIDRSLILLLLDGYSYKKMSEMIGISESNIGVKIHRIKKKLVNNLKQCEHDGI